MVWSARRNDAGTMHAWLWGGSALVGALIALVCADVALATRMTGDLGLAKQFWASFFFISIACDYRYLYVVDLSALVGLLYLALDPALRS